MSFLLSLNNVRDRLSWYTGVCICQIYGTVRLTWVHFLICKLYLYQPTQSEHNEKTSVFGVRETWFKFEFWYFLLGRSLDFFHARLPPLQMGWLSLSPLGVRVWRHRIQMPHAMLAHSWRYMIIKTFLFGMAISMLVTHLCPPEGNPEDRICAPFFFPCV